MGEVEWRGSGAKPFNDIIRKVNGKAGLAVELDAADVGAYTKAQTDAAIAAALAAFNPITAGVAGAGQTTIALNKAMLAGAEGEAAVFVGGALQDASQYTFNGTATATLAFAMAAGDRWRVLNFA